MSLVAFNCNVYAYFAVLPVLGCRITVTKVLLHLFLKSQRNEMSKATTHPFFLGTVAPVETQVSHFGTKEWSYRSKSAKNEFYGEFYSYLEVLAGSDRLVVIFSSFLFPETHISLLFRGVI